MTWHLGPGHPTTQLGSADVLLSQHPAMSKRGRTERQTDVLSSTAGSAATGSTKLCATSRMNHKQKVN